METRKDIFKMSRKEVKRLGILEQIFNGYINQQQAAGLLDISDRQIRRLIKRVRSHGPEGLIHGSRGRPSNRCLDRHTKAEILRIYSEKYYDFGPTFAAEKLAECDGITIHHETLRTWLMGTEYVQHWCRKKRPHRRQRERKAYYGEMIQMDGSHHDWFEGRDEGCVLMGYIDDATNMVHAVFTRYEGTFPAFEGLVEYFDLYGLPHNIYLDNHTTYKSPSGHKIEEQLLNKRSLSQFQRAMEELGITVIHARSPQAKGRVERLFRTFQDRLVKELRLAQITSIEEANIFLKDYLVKHNNKFAVRAQRRENLHRPNLGKEELKQILCIRNQRRLQKDSTIKYNNRVYLVTHALPRRMKKVDVEEWLDGSLHIRYENQDLAYKELAVAVRIGTEKKEREVQSRSKKPNKPSDTHPWKKGPRSNYALCKS